VNVLKKINISLPCHLNFFYSSFLINHSMIEKDIQMKDNKLNHGRKIYHFFLSKSSFFYSSDFLLFDKKNYFL
jgi:hypothetical protein